MQCLYDAFYKRIVYSKVYQLQRERCNGFDDVSVSDTVTAKCESDKPALQHCHDYLYICVNVLFDIDK